MRPGMIAMFLICGPAFAGDVVLHVSNVRDSSGKISALLFSSADGFPADRARADYQVQAEARKGVTEIVIRNVKPGKYAFSVIHDSNSNSKLDRNFVGIPVEGAGTSNGSSKGKPVFHKALIEVSAGAKVPVEMGYW